MKADIKLSTFSYSVANLHVCSCVLKSLSVPMRVRSSSGPSLPVLLQFTPCRRKWAVFCGWCRLNRSSVFNVNLIRCTRTKQHRFTDLCDLKETGTVLRQNRPHAALCPRTMLNAYMKHSKRAIAKYVRRTSSELGLRH
jgi:hypothetical protein